MIGIMIEEYVICNKCKTKFIPLIYKNKKNLCSNCLQKCYSNFLNNGKLFIGINEKDKTNLMKKAEQFNILNMNLLSEIYILNNNKIINLIKEYFCIIIHILKIDILKNVTYEVNNDTKYIKCNKCGGDVLEYLQKKYCPRCLINEFYNKSQNEYDKVIEYLKNNKITGWENWLYIFENYMEKINEYKKNLFLNLENIINKFSNNFNLIKQLLLK
jgi:hypothetical protein